LIQERFFLKGFKKKEDTAGGCALNAKNDLQRLKSTGGNMTKILIIISILIFSFPGIACNTGGGSVDGGSTDGGSVDNGSTDGGSSPSPSPGISLGDLGPGPAPDGGGDRDYDVIEPKCDMIINGYCVNKIEDGVWHVKGHPRGEIWYRK
jgi:hypothetical protein